MRGFNNISVLSGTDHQCISKMAFENQYCTNERRCHPTSDKNGDDNDIVHNIAFTAKSLNMSRCLKYA